MISLRRRHDNAIYRYRMPKAAKDLVAGGRKYKELIYFSPMETKHAKACVCVGVCVCVFATLHHPGKKILFSGPHESAFFLAAS